MVMKKSKSQKFATPHAIVRGGERYGITAKRCRKIYANIQGGINIVHIRSTRDRIQYACFDRDRWFHVVYCLATNKIITFLSLDGLSHYEKMALRNSPFYRNVGIDSFGVFDEILPEDHSRFC